MSSQKDGPKRVRAGYRGLRRLGAKGETTGRRQLQVADDLLRVLAVEDKRTAWKPDLFDNYVTASQSREFLINSEQLLTSANMTVPDFGIE